MSGSKSAKPDDKVENSRSPSPTKKTVIESRRAEQNRAAQRAFRQRKELYVKELEAKVNSMADWPERMEQLENENESLKRKIAELLGNREESSNKKLFVNNDPTPSKSNSSSSTSSNSRKGNKASSRSNTTSPPPTTSPSSTKAVIGEKGKVLDDLVSILRTRNRPPIPSHPPN